MGQGGVGEERWEEGMLGHLFIGLEGERGGRASEGNERRWWCTIMVVEAFVSIGDRPGWWWGVMRGVPGGGVHAHARRRRLWLSVRGGRRSGGTRVSSRGGGWLAGLAGLKAKPGQLKKNNKSFSNFF
jgi:hypothetical protein